MTTAQNLTLAQAHDYTQEQINLIKQTLAPETNELEFALFMEVARVQGLSPLQRQIHAVMRYDSQAGRKKMVIQTGIDGYRLIAARTGLHLGTTDATFGPANAAGFPSWAQVTVKKLVHGHVAEYPATAFWDEYVQTVKGGAPNSMWASRPKGQLSKCAESLALRKAFPAELSGVYSDVEMEQADNPAPLVQVEQQVKSEPDARLAAWQKKAQEMSDRVLSKLHIDHNVPLQALWDKHPWQTSVEGCEALYADLVAYGKKHVKKEKPAPAADVVDAEFHPETEGKITAGQRKALMAYLSRGGLPDKSELRSGFYNHAAPEIQPGTRTNDLTAEQASELIEFLSGMETDELTGFVEEFMQGVQA